VWGGVLSRAFQKLGSCLAVGSNPNGNDVRISDGNLKPLTSPRFKRSRADNLVETKAENDLKILRRYEEWHKDPATPPQKSLLRKLYKGRVFPFCVCKQESTAAVCPTCKAKTDLSKGQAGHLINAAIAGKIATT
jgi:rubrerythrin